MDRHFRVCVIGGGVVGCSVLYHLAKFGWSDIILVERSELTSGSTWHAAGGFHTINGDTNMAALQGYTIRLYRELEEVSGISCGLHHVGGITLAESPERLDMFKAERAKHRLMGLETNIATPKEIAELAPLTNLDGIIGGLYDPLDGHLDPSGTTHAYARAACLSGATVESRNLVIETNPRPDGMWEVVTANGTIVAESVVNAAGLWAREVGALAGVYLPIHPMEHQYLVTDNLPEFRDARTEYPHVVDPAGGNYLRQEGNGLCIGFYEQGCEPWAVTGTPPDFGPELLEDRLERISDSIDSAYYRYPVLERTGVKRIINGPFTFAPDGNPLVGPVPGLKNYWSACGVMAGFSQGGGVGLTLAQWMIEGEPERDSFALDVARFGPWISPSYTLPKVIEFYQRRFSVTYPNEELAAARPFRTSPMYDYWLSQNAVFGAQFGTEVVNYFALEGTPLFETPSFRRSNAWQATREEVLAVRTGVGINEIQNFGKYRVAGVGSRSWLNRIFAGRIPKPGKVTLAPMLSHRGRIIGDFTISCFGENDFQLTASYAAQSFHMRWLQANLPESGVSVQNVSDSRLGFQIAGPMARKLLSRTTDNDVSAEAFRFMEIKRMQIGLSNAMVQRLSFTGDLGYEIYVDATSVRSLFETLSIAGEDLGLRPFGMRAMMSLRLDKFFGSWLREYSPDYTPAETGIDRFIDWEKNEMFVGRLAAEREKNQGPSRVLCTFEVDARDADVIGDEPIWLGGEVVGFCTSGGYSHFADKSIAFGFVPAAEATSDLEIAIEILGEMRTARRLTDPVFDPDGERMRG